MGREAMLCWKRTLFALLSAGYVCLGEATMFRTEVEAQEQPPPEPEGMQPQKQGSSYDSKNDACQACRFAATGSCAMYKTCLCYATNTFFKIGGIPTPTDTNDWHWACGNEGGSKY